MLIFNLGSYNTSSSSGEPFINQSKIESLKHGCKRKASLSEKSPDSEIPTSATGRKRRGRKKENDLKISDSGHSDTQSYKVTVKKTKIGRKKQIGDKEGAISSNQDHNSFERTLICSKGKDKDLQTSDDLSAFLKYQLSSSQQDFQQTNVCFLNINGRVVPAILPIDKKSQHAGIKCDEFRQDFYATSSMNPLPIPRNQPLSLASPQSAIQKNLIKLSGVTSHDMLQSTACPTIRRTATKEENGDSGKSMGASDMSLIEASRSSNVATSLSNVVTIAPAKGMQLGNGMTHVTNKNTCESKKAFKDDGNVASKGTVDKTSYDGYKTIRPEVVETENKNLSKKSLSDSTSKVQSSAKVQGSSGHKSSSEGHKSLCNDVISTDRKKLPSDDTLKAKTGSVLKSSSKLICGVFPTSISLDDSTVSFFDLILTSFAEVDQMLKGSKFRGSLDQFPFYCINKIILRQH